MLVPGVADAARPAARARGLVSVSAAHHLFATPSTAARVLGSVPATIGGEATLLPVEDHARAQGIAWLRVTFRSVKGWLPQSATRPASAPRMAPALVDALNAIVDRAGPSAGAAVEDPQGFLLWSRRDSATHPLASNTKLFTAVAGLQRFGTSISGLLKAILIPSDDGLAQSLSDRVGDGSAALGARRAVRAASSLGVRVSLQDGNGLSYADRASPLEVAHLLVAVFAQPYFRSLYDALPTAGRTGTLAPRMRGSVARGRCHAKTGTLALTSNLSGYCRTLSGHVLVFSMLIDHEPVGSSRALQDEFAGDLVSRG